MAEESSPRAAVAEEETTVAPSMEAEAVEATAAPQETGGEPAVQTEVGEEPVVPQAIEEPTAQTEAAEAPKAPQDVGGEPSVESKAIEAPTAPQEMSVEPAVQAEGAEAAAAPQEIGNDSAMQTEAAEAPAVAQEAKPADSEVAEAAAAVVAAAVVAEATPQQNEAREASAMEVDTPAHAQAEANTPPKSSTEMQEDTPEKAEAPAATPAQEVPPLTPLFQFLQDRRQSIMQEYGVKKITEVAKLAKELFDLLSPEERKVYEDDYERKKKAYQAWLAVQEGQGKEKLAAAKAKRAAMRASKKNRRASGAVATTADGKSAAAKPAAMKKKLAKAKPRSKAAQNVNKAVRPTRPMLQYMKENRFKIMTQHKLRRATELPKKAAELWNMLPWEQRKPYVDRYNEQNKAWLEFKARERTAIQQYERTMGTKAPAEKTKKRSAAVSSRPASSSSKARKTAAGKTAAAKAPEAHVILSSEAMEKAKKMGTAASGLPYLRLLEKLLSTPGLGDVAEEDALGALKRSKGNVNVARNELRSNVIEV